MMPRQRIFLRTILAFLVAMLAGCGKTPQSAVQPNPRSNIEVQKLEDGSLRIKTSSAEFELSPRTYLRATLVRSDGQQTLDDPSANQTGSTVTADGKPIDDFRIDPTTISITDSEGKLGPAGKHVTAVAKSAGSPLEEKISVEVYDDFPTLAIWSASFRNNGSTPIQLEHVSLQDHRINASLADSSAKPHELWSFQGASYEWGQDEILPIPAHFSRPNVLGQVVHDGVGGGVPVVAFWTKSVGMAIGHLETIPEVLSLPVEVSRDGRINTKVSLDPETSIEPGHEFATPRTFVAVYQGDFYQPLNMWSRALQKEGWQLAKPNREDFGIAWCGWGYEFNVTPKDMLGTIPKLKELGIHWATLDDRWFNTYGDWEPRKETFPGDSIKKMVDEFHKEGIKAQIWWYPLATENGTGKWESHKYVVSEVAKQHPDWLVLDRNGKPAHIFRDLAVMCPALPEVQEYHKKLAEKFIRDWGFDGHKLDNIYTVPACYNPKHHHKSPQDSIRAVADVYRAIYQTTRELKPDSVTQICPCGTAPNLAWLPYMDQAVTADPVGGVQVRRRVKMYKAVLGPAAAVYGDHVELSEMSKDKKGEWTEHGRDFSSTLGTGGVLGTKFTWPPNNPKFTKVALTPDKEQHWKKWTDLYNSKMLSSGDFKDLYVYGYDVPEAYAIEKDGRMYYAFYAATPQTPWKGQIELRGLQPGKYRVTDYVNSRDLGEIQSSSPTLKVDFKGSLLVEAEKR
ncbi:MAG TPA: glycoside hydrolase family 36 protein [Terriglobales bacterium]|jgi:alpha-galactosidase|nr:glycoside hydrolase family 36 protein [Terriglobales bacterium]